MTSYKRETDIVHGVHRKFTTSRDLVAPIHMTSTYEFHSTEHGADLFAGKSEGFIYSRLHNPTVDLLQDKIAHLEGGETAIATASGMAAIGSAVMTLAGPGDNFVSCSTIYGGAYALFHTDLKKFDIKARFVPPSALPDLESRIDKKTRFLYLETPANPTLDILDIRAWADLAHQYKIPLIVDNTFASPYLQRPLELGADMVVHSTTKYLNGHGDVVGGMIVGTKEMCADIRGQVFHHFGPVMSPFNAWLISRGLKTLAVRMDRHCENAGQIARWLDDHPKVETVWYPGLPSHPGHEIAKNQMDGFGGMIAFEVKGGLESGKAVMNRVDLCTLAVSLGDCETLVQHPASMTHSPCTPEEREAAGITDGLIRLSVGLEHPEDIMADLDRAMTSAG